jgi:hypothetical protein
MKSRHLYGVLVAFDRPLPTSTDPNEMAEFVVTSELSGRDFALWNFEKPRQGMRLHLSRWDAKDYVKRDQFGAAPLVEVPPRAHVGDTLWLDPLGNEARAGVRDGLIEEIPLQAVEAAEPLPAVAPTRRRAARAV